MAILEENSEDCSISDKFTTTTTATTTGTPSESAKADGENNPSGYLVMLPSIESIKRNGSRSRTSSCVEDGFGHRLYNENLSSSASSMTSGTPSTDNRFSNYHLDKITAYFTEEKDQLMRPTRTYSVGSKPEFTKHQKNDRSIVDAFRHARTRAFSVGSKKAIKNERDPLFYKEVQGKLFGESDKSTSVPSLNKGSSETVSQHGDFVEMDFSKNTPTSTDSHMGHMMIQSPSSPNTSDYMEMNPSSSWKSCQSGKILSSSFTSGSASVTVTATSASQRQQQQQQQHPQLVTARSSVLGSIDDNVSDYLDMRPSSVESNQSRPASKPIKIVNKKKANDLCEFDEQTSHDFGIDDHDDHHQAIFPMSLEKDTKDIMMPPPPLTVNNFGPEPMVIDTTLLPTPSGGSSSSGVSVDRDSSSPMTISPTPTPLPMPVITPAPTTLALIKPIATLPPIDDPGDYATLAPNCQVIDLANKQQQNTRQHYAELEFTNPPGNNQINALASTRKDCNPPKPLYAQILFPNSNENVK